MTPIQRSTRSRECARPDCPVRFDPFLTSNPWPARYCSPLCHLKDKPPAPLKPRTQLVTRAPSQPKRRRPISEASPAQRAKRAAGTSIVSGETQGLDAAHLCSRGLGGCDDPLCVVPLTRAEHRAFDSGDLDLLPYLVPRYADELAHALVHYRGDLPALLERLTGERWAPVGGLRLVPRDGAA